MENFPTNHNEKAASFEDFYREKIASLVTDYKKNSKSSNQTGILVFFLPVSTIAVFIAYLLLDDFQVGGFIALVLLGFSVYSIYSYVKSEDAFMHTFKIKVIKEIADFLIPGVRYEPLNFISSKFYKASSLYRRRYIDIWGDDFFEGQYKNVNFQASELNTRFQGSRYYQNIFNGIFFMAETGHFEGGTYIWAKNNVQLPASIGDEHFRLFPMPQVYKINTGNDGFSMHYSVYSSYPAEAASILSEEMMQGMLNLKKQLKKNISFSFVAGRVYVAIENMEDLLEPVTDLADKEAIKEFFFTILLFPSIINQLKLYKYI